MVAVSPNTTYAQPASWLRGGYRFLTITLLTAGPVSVSNVSAYINFMPQWETDDLTSGYTGYFWTPEEPLLTQVWYGGAYS